MSEILFFSWFSIFAVHTEWRIKTECLLIYGIATQVTCVTLTCWMTSPWKPISLRVTLLRPHGMSHTRPPLRVSNSLFSPSISLVLSLLPLNCSIQGCTNSILPRQCSWITLRTKCFNLKNHLPSSVLVWKLLATCPGIYLYRIMHWSYQVQYVITCWALSFMLLTLLLKNGQVQNERGLQICTVLHGINFIPGLELW